MKQFRHLIAVFLLLALLCGCTAPQQAAPVPASDSLRPAAVSDEAQTESTDDFHLEYQTVPLPAPLLSVTALTVLGDTVLLGGFTEDGLSLASMTLGGETGILPLPDGAAYLYALAPDGAGGAWLLSGSLPAAYADGYGFVHLPKDTPEDRLALTHYDASFAMQETVPLQTDCPDGPRFFQLCKTENGFLLLSGSLLLSLDRTGAETGRQTAETDDGRRYQSMALSGGVLCVLTRDFYGASPLPELRRFEPDTLAALEPLACTADVTGLGTGTDGRLLLGSRETIDAGPADGTAAETLLTWRELGVTNTAEQLLPAESGLILYSPDDTELALLRRLPGPPPEKTVLTLAVAAEDTVLGTFAVMLEEFNRSQDRYLVDYTVYSDSAVSEDGGVVPADRLRTQIAAGQAPDLYAFYTMGFNAPPLAAEDVGTDLLPLLGADFSAGSLLPNLYALLTEDGCLYALPLTVSVDTLVGPASLFPHPGVTLADLEQARQQMPDGWVALDSWNTPENLFSLCMSYCIGAFTDKAAGTCDFENQRFYDYLTWCRTWGGDGSTPAAPERTLIRCTRNNALGQLAGRSDTAASDWFGEPGYTYIGYPTADGTGGSGYCIYSSLAVSPRCRDLDGAKAFLNFCFSYRQDDALPANNTLLHAEMEEYMAGSRKDWRGESMRISEADAAQFYALLESVTVLEGQDPPLAEILSEEAGAYFAGGCTAGQAAGNIQSRASLYLLEQQGKRKPASVTNAPG